MPKTIVIATPHGRYDALESALRRNFRVERLREQTALSLARLAAINPDYVFFPHWSWIIPATIHEKFPCVIFHMTDLPFGRGGSPLQNLIMCGVRTTKITALKCTAELDAGPVYLKKPLPLDGTAEEIFASAAVLMEEMIQSIVMQNIQPQPQTGEPTFFTRRKPEEGDLIQAATLKKVYDMIRMLDAEGYPHAFVTVGDLRFEFSGAKMSGQSVEARVKIVIGDKS